MISSSRRHISVSCVIASLLIFFTPKNDCLGSVYDSAALPIWTNCHDSVRFNCTMDSKSSVDWQYKKTSSSTRVDIFIGNAQGCGGQKSNLYASRNRYQIKMNKYLGRYDLLIDNVRKSDEGFYECSDVSDPDSSTIWKLNVIGGEDEEELCSNDVTALVGETVRLIFPTTKEDSIQLKHRSVDRNEPRHVFKDRRLVNDYYGRYGFSPSNNGSWTLVIKDVKTSDAGSFICSEDNGLGQQYVKELVVIREDEISCSPEIETCADEFNVTCKLTYAGNCVPRLMLPNEGRTVNRVIINGDSVSLMGVAHRTRVTTCVIPIQPTPLNSTCQRPDCNGTTIEDASSQTIVLIISITVPLIIILILHIFIVYVIVKRKEIERNAVSEREQHLELVERSSDHLMANGSSVLPL